MLAGVNLGPNRDPRRRNIDLNPIKGALERKQVSLDPRRSSKHRTSDMIISTSNQVPSGTQPTSPRTPPKLIKSLTKQMSAINILGTSALSDTDSQ